MLDSLDKIDRTVRRLEKWLPKKRSQADLLSALPGTFSEFCESIKIKTLEGIQPFKLLEWQAKFTQLVLEDLAETKASISVMKSRQIGSTLLVLVMELWLSLTIPQHTTLLLHLTYGDAWNAARRLRKLIGQLSIPLVTDSLGLLEFPNGSTIHFRSADPETCGRGLENVDFIHVEEQGHQEDLRGTLEVISPMRTWSPHSKLVMIGTPNGKQMHYYTLLKDVVPENEIIATVEGIRAGTCDPYQVFSRDRKYAILINWRTIQRFREEANPSFLERVKTEENLTEIGILTEYELEFSESESAVFSPALIKACEMDMPTEKQDIHTGQIWYELPSPKHFYVAGADPNGGSNTSSSAAGMVVLRLFFKGDRRCYRLAYVYRKKSGTASSHLSRWADALNDFAPAETGIETNNTGNTWIDQLSQMCPQRKLTGQTTTESTRASMITLVQIALERGELEIPKDSQLSKELLSFIVNPSGKMEAAEGATDDLVLSLGHCLRAAQYGQI